MADVFELNCTEHGYELKRGNVVFGTGLAQPKTDDEFLEFIIRVGIIVCQELVIEARLQRRQEQR